MVLYNLLPKVNVEAFLSTASSKASLKLLNFLTECLTEVQ
nr:MAG TPA: hypothetical protein [Bacteriophage sp.]